jgi:Phosphotransferase enzyme family
LAAFAELSREWFSDVLSGSIGRHIEIAVVEVEPLSASSAIGELGRARLHYSPRSAPGPDSVVMKRRSREPLRQGADRALGLFDRESYFYTTFAKCVPVQSPRLYFAGDGDITPLVLEDLGHCKAGEQSAGLSLREAERLVDTLADMHAACWGIDDDWLLSMNDPMFGGMWKTMICSGLSTLEKRLAAELPARVIDSLLAAAPRWDEVLGQLGSGPPTLVHNDFRLDNIVFRPDGTPVILDWQVPAIGRGTHDLAFLLAGSVDYDLLKDSWRALVEQYHERLVARGIADYGLAQCEEHYRQSVVHAAAPGVALLGDLEIPDERDLGATIVIRSLRHAADLESFELLNF